MVDSEIVFLDITSVKEKQMNVTNQDELIIFCRQSRITLFKQQAECADNSLRNFTSRSEFSRVLEQNLSTINKKK